MSPRPRFSVHTDPPSAPDFNLLRLLHRTPQSYAVFLHRPDPHASELQTLKHVRVDKLPAGLTRSEALRCDGYFSINGYRRWGTRQTIDLSALNAAAVDLDFYKHSSAMKWQEVVETVNSAIDEGVIPMPSVIVNSGQGAWLLWLLVAADDPGQAPTAPPSNQLFLRAINTRLADLIADRIPRLHVDPSSAELTRSLRMPGSINSKSASYVNFLVHDTPWGDPFSYTLDQLAAQISVQQPTYRRHQRSFLMITDRPAATGKKKGGGANLGRSMSVRLEELQRIECNRGGFREGQRNFALHITAVSLHALHKTPEEIETLLHELAARCQPPLPNAQVRWAAKGKPYKYSNRMIAKQLGVLVEEADALNLRHIRPDFVAKRPSANIAKGRREFAVRRRAELRAIVDETEKAGKRDLPSLRKLRERLSERGFSATLLTVARDLEHLRIARSRQRGRRKSGARQLSLLPR